MRNRVAIVIIMIAVIMAIILSGCAPDKDNVFTYDINDIADYSIDIHIGTTIYTFNRDMLADYTLYDLSTTTTKKEVTTTDNWKGLMLADILTAAGNEGQVTELKFTAEDDYFANVILGDTPINSYYLVLFKMVDSEYQPLVLDDIKVVSVNDTFQNKWVKNIVKIEVNPTEA